MPAFPLEASNGSRASTRDHPNLQHNLFHHSHSYRNPRLQQHQPASSSARFQQKGGSTRKDGKKSNHQLQYTPSLGSTASESSVGRYGGGIETYDDHKCLPDMMNGNDMRSVPNLELPNMAEENHHSRIYRDPMLATAGTPSTDWGGGASVDIVNMLSSHLPPLPNNSGEGRLLREQTYPPPPPLPNNSGEDRLLREQTYPPPTSTAVPNSEYSLMHSQVCSSIHATGLPTNMISMSGWAHPSSTVPASGGYMRSGRCGSRGGGETGERRGKDRGGVGIGGGGGGGLSNGNACAVGDPGLCAGTGINSGDFSCVNEGANLGQDPHGKELWGVDDVGCDSIGARGEENADMSDRGVRRVRRSSFDKLAAMIPGVPHHMQSPSSSSAPGPDNGADRATHSGTKPPSTLASAANITHSASVVRLTARQIKPRKPRDSGDARHKRVGSSKSCGPCLRGEPRDPAKLARRRAAIEKYMHKRSRRRFADSTRDQSPSRSRPKAAARRPRKFGKFVKVVKDFLPVTAASHGRQIMSATPTAAPHPAGGEGARGRVRGRRSGLKQEDYQGRGPIPGGAFSRIFDDFSSGGLQMTSYGPHD